MQQRELGKGGPLVGQVGFGAMSFAGFYGATDEPTSLATLARAVDLGVTHIDTARVYGIGRSEESIGKYLRERGNNPFVIATKGGMYTDRAGTRHFDNRPITLREHLEASLYRLGVEHVPLYYIHRRDQQIPIEDVMETLLRFKDEGKIGGIGFSEISPASLRRAAAVGPVMAVQSEYSLWTRLPEMGVLQATAEVGAAFVAFSPVARGMLTAVDLDPADFTGADIRRNGPRFQKENYPTNQAYMRAFRAVAEAFGYAPASLAIAWTLDQAPHVIPIPGTRTPEHLEVLAAADSVTFTDELRQRLDDALPIGFAHGDRYSDAQMVGIERYC